MKRLAGKMKSSDSPPQAVEPPPTAGFPNPPALLAYEPTSNPYVASVEPMERGAWLVYLANTPWPSAVRMILSVVTVVGIFAIIINQIRKASGSDLDMLGCVVSFGFFGLSVCISALLTFSAVLDFRDRLRGVRERPRLFLTCGTLADDAPDGLALVCDIVCRRDWTFIPPGPIWRLQITHGTNRKNRFIPIGRSKAEAMRIAGALRAVLALPSPDGGESS